MARRLGVDALRRERPRERALAVAQRRLDQGEVDQVALGMAAPEPAGAVANGTEKPTRLAVIALAARPDCAGHRRAELPGEQPPEKRRVGTNCVTHERPCWS